MPTHPTNPLSDRIRDCPVGHALDLHVDVDHVRLLSPADDVQERAIDCELMNPSFLNLFRKKFTLERVVPTVSASMSCEIFGTTRGGVSC